MENKTCATARARAAAPAAGWSRLSATRSGLSEEGASLQRLYRAGPGRSGPGRPGPGTRGPARARRARTSVRAGGQWPARAPRVPRARSNLCDQLRRRFEGLNISTTKRGGQGEQSEAEPVGSDPQSLHQTWNVWNSAENGSLICLFSETKSNLRHRRSRAHLPPPEPSVLFFFWTELGCCSRTPLFKHCSFLRVREVLRVASARITHRDGPNLLRVCAQDTGVLSAARGPRGPWSPPGSLVSTPGPREGPSTEAASPGSVLGCEPDG